MAKPTSFLERPAKALLASAVLMTVTVPLNLRAASFLLNEQSVSGLGSAYAGGAAQAEDASTIFFNPAGLALLDRGEAQLGGHYLFPTARFHDDGSQLRRPGTIGEPLTGINSGDSLKDKPVPNLYLSQPVFRNRAYGDLSVGFGLSVPFGLESNYDPSWVGRYQALRSKLSTFDLQPSIAYRFVDRIALGASLDVQYASARFSQAIDFRALGARDGISELHGDDWDLGFTVGAILEYLKADQNPSLQEGRLGVSYRSGITHNLQGSAQFRDVPAPLRQPFPPDQAVSARLNLPEIYHFSVYQRFLRRFALLGDIEWTRWGRLQQVPITFNNPSTPTNGFPPLDYKDTLRYAIGFEWYACKALTFRLGFAYDETPIRNAETRTPRIPDDNRYLVSTGLQYKPASWVAFDVGYAHVFGDHPDVNFSDAQGHTLRGSFDFRVDIVSASVTFLWGGPKRWLRRPQKENQLAKVI